MTLDPGQTQKTFDPKSQLEILKLLNQGLYLQQISQKTSLSLEKISRILNWLESEKYITLTSRYPRL